LRVQVSAGGLTAHLRNEWMLNSILDDGGRKTRDDHRHHAVDALAIALNSPATVKRLQEAAERASAAGRRLFARVDEPWLRFVEDAREHVLAVNVSARVSKKVAGDLHEDTNYSKEQRFIRADGSVRAVRHVRKPVDALTESQVDDVVDPVVREKVRTWIREQAGQNSKEPIAFPTIRTHDAREIPIKTVRIRKVVGVEPVGKGPRTRYVKPGANHHTVVVATLDEKSREARWDDHPVTRLEVHRRQAAGEPIIKTDWGPGKAFKFSLSANEHLVVKNADGKDQLVRVISVSENACEFRLHSDARAATEARRPGSGARIRLGGDAMRKRGVRKVRVTYLGEIVPAND
jgi:CRISPR-associated endonuclease Csn1